MTKAKVTTAAKSAVTEPASREKITTIVLILILDICLQFHVAEHATELIMSLGVFWHDIISAICDAVESVTD